MVGNAPDKFAAPPSHEIDPTTADTITVTEIKSILVWLQKVGDKENSMRIFTYPALLQPGKGQGIIVVTFRDVPEAISQGNEDDARTMGSDALGVTLLGLLSVKRPLPKPSKPRTGEVLLSVEADMAAKIAVLEAFRESGLTQAELAARLGKDAREVRRILDPDHATKMPALIAALGALGRKLVIGVEAA